jgi:hypothetical protein
MKVRNKSKKERDYDNLKLDEAKEKFLTESSSFAGEFAELEGDVFHSTVRSFNNAAWQYDHAKEIVDMTKVGDDWDWSKGIISCWRYRNV